MSPSRFTGEDYKAMVEQAPNGVLVFDINGEVLVASHLASTILGYKREEMIHMHVEDFLPEEFRATHVLHRQDFNQNPRTRQMGSGLDLYARHKDGSRVPVDIALSQLIIDNAPYTSVSMRIRQSEVDAERMMERVVKATAWRSIRLTVYMIALIDIVFTLSVSLIATSVSGDQSCFGMQQLARVQARQFRENQSALTAQQIHKLFPGLPPAQLDHLLAQQKRQNANTIAALDQLASASCRTLF